LVLVAVAVICCVIRPYVYIAFAFSFSLFICVYLFVCLHYCTFEISSSSSRIVVQEEMEEEEVEKSVVVVLLLLSLLLVLLLVLFSSPKTKLWWSSSIVTTSFLLSNIAPIEVASVGSLSRVGPNIIPKLTECIILSLEYFVTCCKKVNNSRIVFWLACGNWDSICFIYIAASVGLVFAIASKNNLWLLNVNRGSDSCLKNLFKILVTICTSVSGGTVPPSSRVFHRLSISFELPATLNNPSVFNTFSLFKNDIVLCTIEGTGPFSLCSIC